MLVQFVSHHYSNKLGNSGEKQVGMKRFFILSFTAGNTKTVFEVVDGFLNIYSDFVGGIPFRGAADCSGISAKVLFRINVDHSSTGRCCTRSITMAYTFCFLCDAVPFPFHFGADKFHGWKAAAQMGSAPFPFHWKGSVMRTAGNAVIIYGVIHPFDFEFVFQGNIRFFKGCFLQQIFINPDGIESGIPQKRFGIDKRMLPEEILQCRDQRLGICKALVLVRRTRFLSNNDLGMGFEKIFVVKGNMPDDAQPVCNDAEFKSIAEMPIDIHLLDSGVGGGMGRHGAVGSFIGIKGIVQAAGFFKGFELFDNTVGIFGIVFGHPGFNAGESWMLFPNQSVGISVRSGQQGDRTWIVSPIRNPA